MARIVVFGATGYTGRLTAERLVALGTRPVLAGRSRPALDALAESLGGLETAQADALRPNSVFDLVEADDVLISTVGPFAKWGDAAVRAAIAAGATYLDSTGEPVFIRRVFEELDAPAARGGAALLTAMGFDFVPGALAGALALEEGASDAVRVDVGYFPLGALRASAGTRESLVGAALHPGFAYRGGRIVGERAAARVRSFVVGGGQRTGVSVGGAEHYGLPRAYPRLRDVNVHLGGFGPLSRALQAGTIAGSVATRVPGVRTALRMTGERVVRLAGAPEAGTTTENRAWVVGAAYGADGRPLAEVHLSGPDPYAFTAGCLAWAARRAAAGGVQGVGALGPVDAFGLEALEAGCAEAGLLRVP